MVDAHASHNEGAQVIRCAAREGLHDPGRAPIGERLDKHPEFRSVIERNGYRLRVAKEDWPGEFYAKNFYLFELGAT